MADGRQVLEGAPVMIPRREFPNWAYYLSRCTLVPLLWVVSRVLQIFGLFPRIIARAINRMFFKVGPLALAANDVVIGSYYKSGTNWAMQMALQVAHHGRAEFEHIHDIVPWYEVPNDSRRLFAVTMDDERVRHGADHGLKIIKCHLPLDHIGYCAEGCYIWVIRDPKDVLVSSYHFTRSIALGPMMPSLARWLDVFLSPDSWLGSWAEHVRGGWERRHLSNVLFLTYEEMKSDAPSAIGRMADLMQVDLTAAELDEVLRRSSFEYMKPRGHKFDTVGMSPPWVKPHGAMIRSGRKGSASELLSKDEQRRIDDYWRAELIRIGCDFPYDEHYGSRD
jgi:hypothetical protein